MPRAFVRPAQLLVPASLNDSVEADDAWLCATQETPARWMQDARLFALAWAGGFLFFLAFLG